MATNPVVWFEIYVQDMARAQAFYEHVLAVKLQPLPMEGWQMLCWPAVEDGGGASGALVCAEGVASGNNSTLVYFNCADCAIEASRVVAAGGKIQQEKFSIAEHGFIAMAFDTEGNLFGLYSRE